MTFFCLCPKIVRPKKFKCYQANDQVWWSNQFKELEAGIKVPPYRKLSELKQVFSDDEIFNLTQAGLQFEDDLIDVKKRFRKGPYFKIKKKTFKSSYYVPARRCNLFQKKTLFADSLIEFCKKPREEADRWSPRPRWFSISLIPCINKATKIEEMLAENFEEFFNKVKTLSPIKVDKETIFIHKARKIEKMLAENFEEYFNKIETITPITIDKETILSVFEITCTLPFASVVFINLRELRAVPDYVAKYLGDKSLGTSCALQREINRDLIVAYSKPISHAFGRMLPVRLRRYKTSTSNAMNWVKRETRYERLRTFEAVFEGILDLETSKGFVLWLRNHREINPPECLEGTCIKMKASKKFFVLRKTFKTPDLSKCNSFISEESYTGINIMV